ncbi:MAG: hypothetical protein JNK48_18175 [Bryobacterales bacterium]|nr:hypothetical protein [Bryobacterales bacterium]
MLCSARTESRYSELYEQYYGRKNVYVEALRKRRVSFLVAPGEELCPDQELVRTEYYNDYLRPQHVRYSLGMVYASNEIHAHLGATRPFAAGEFGVDENKLANALGPHFAQAMSLYNRFYRLQQRCEALEDLANRQPYGVIWLDAHGRVAEANSTATGLLAAGDGLRAEKGVLYAGLTGETKKLHQMVAAAIGRQIAAVAGSMRVARRSGAPPYAVTVAPVRAAEARHAAIVIVVDPHQPVHIDRRRLSELFALTQTEADLCAHLAEGLSLAEIAAEMCITTGTARAHLKHIFMKTQTGRQAELVRLLLTCGASAAL